MIFAPYPERIVEEMIGQGGAKNSTPIKFLPASGSLEKVREGQLGTASAIR